MHSGELRQNLLTGQWVAIAPRRGRRPIEPDPHLSAPDAAPGSRCPFCTGHEDDLPGILAETRDGEGKWQTRVVPNLFPAFTNDPERGEWVETSLAGADSGLGSTLALGSDVPVVLADPLPAVGYQEVIVESPEHDLAMADMGAERLAHVLRTYQDRYRSVSQSVPSCRVFVFRNTGREAGNSLAHPHAQLIATAVVPPSVRVREIRMVGYHGDHGRCLLCSLPNIEPAWEDRVVARNDAFTAVVPWAAATPWEMWIIPRRHQAEFGEATPEEMGALGEVLDTVLGALRDRAGDPAWNLMIHSPRHSRAGSKAFHWYMQIRPRATQLAGFELSTGVTINASSPDADARVLRGDDA